MRLWISETTLRRKLVLVLLSDFWARKTRRRLRCALRLASFRSLSSAAWSSASLIFRWISASVSPDFASILIFCSLPTLLIFRRDMEDAVGVDVEGDFDLGHAARSRRDIGQVKPADLFVVSGHRTLSLENDDGHGRLVVAGSREDLFFLRRDRRIALDERSQYAAERLDAESEGNDVEEKNVFDVSRKDSALDGGADRNRFIRIDPFMRLAAEEFFYFLLDRRHTGHTADEDHFADVAIGKACVFHRLYGKARRSFR